MMVVAMLLSWKFCPHSNNLSTRYSFATEKQKNQKGFERKEWWKKST